MSLTDTNLVKVHWVAPNGKKYAENIPMTLDQYVDFVNNLFNLKKQGVKKIE